MPYKRNLRCLYWIAFFEHLILASVIERLFALERGMTLQTIVYMEILFAVVTVVLEIPSGVLADRFGRKHLLVVGAICECLEIFVLIFAQGIALFAVSTLIAAIGNACISGARNALLYDSLCQYDGQSDYEKLLGRIRLLDIAGALIAAISGGALARIFGLTFNYYISTISMGVALFFTCRLIEPPVGLLNNEDVPKVDVREIIRAASQFFQKHLDVLWMIIYSTAIAACYTYVDEFWQVYLGDIGFPIALFGVVSAGFTLARAPGAAMGAWLLRFMRHERIVLLGSCIVVAGIFWQAFCQSAWGIAGMAAVTFSIALMEPIVSGYIHHRADSEARATIESIGSMVERGFTAGIGLLFGYVATQYSVFEGFNFLGFFAAAALVLYACLALKNHQRG